MTHSAPVKTKRPFAVTFVSIWIFLAALLDLSYGALLFVSTDIVAKPPEVQIQIQQQRAENPFLDDQLFTAGEGVVYMTLGILQLVLGIGFWTLKRWAWVGIMSLQALSLLLDLANMLNGDADQPVLSLTFAIVLVLLLNQSKVRQIFGVRSLMNESTHANASFRSGDSN